MARVSPGAGANPETGSAPNLIEVLAGPKTPPQLFWKRVANKGELSNMATFLLMCLGVCLEAVLDEEISRYNFLLAFGLFGFAGGITNWLAVKMLFDRVPGLYGSGVIPNQFKQIREAIKNAIMQSFFDEEFLRSYLREKAPAMVKSIDIGGKLRGYLERPEFDGEFTAKLEQIATSPEGMMLQMVKPMFGGSFAGLVPMMKPTLLMLAAHIGEMAAGTDLDGLVDVAQFRKEVDAMMHEKLQEITPEAVKGMLEHVIREHLGWLVVWGNLFGGLIGIIALGFGALI